MTENSAISKCGTNAGHKAHKDKKEIPCRPCRDAVNEYNKAYRAKHPTAYKEYYERNRGKVIARVKKSTEKNYQNRVAYRTRTAVHIKAKRQEWAKNNPDKIRVGNHRKRARKLSNGMSPYTEAQVLEKYGSNCHLCNEPINLGAPRKVGIGNWQLGLHLDHDLPLSLGGPDTLENVKPSHAICNLKKRRKSHLLLYT